MYPQVQTRQRCIADSTPGNSRRRLAIHNHFLLSPQITQVIALKSGRGFLAHSLVVRLPTARSTSNAITRWQHATSPSPQHTFLVTPSPLDERSTAMSVSVCLSVHPRSRFRNCMSNLRHFLRGLPVGFAATRRCLRRQSSAILKSGVKFSIAVRCHACIAFASL